MTFGVASSTANVSTPVLDFSSVNAEYLVAPFWFPNLSTELVNSTVSWEMEREGDEGGYLLEYAEAAVDEYTLCKYRVKSDFSPTWAMIVSWNVTLFPELAERDRLCQTYSSCVQYYHVCVWRNETVESEDCHTQPCFGWSLNNIRHLHYLCSIIPREFYPYYHYYVQVSQRLASPSETISLFCLGGVPAGASQ